jgi:hypothetical protein
LCRRLVVLLVVVGWLCPLVSMHLVTSVCMRWRWRAWSRSDGCLGQPLPTGPCGPSSLYARSYSCPLPQHSATHDGGRHPEAPRMGRRRGTTAWRTTSSPQPFSSWRPLPACRNSPPSDERQGCSPQLDTFHPEPIHRRRATTVWRTTSSSQLCGSLGLKVSTKPAPTSTLSLPH